MRENRDETREKDQDVFDRTFLGRPGTMIIIVIAIIVISTLINYFN
ncbi:hypothetical protein [Oceanobacillus massiliensis]